MNNTGLDFVSKNGARYGVIKGADNKYYIADPNFELNAAHKTFSIAQGVPVSTSTVAATSKTLSGFLGTTTDTAIQTAAAAVNFIPVVGPIASAVLSVGDAIFGGGDPTPLSQLISEIVQGRATIAQLTNQIAGQVVDTFVIPAGFNAQDKAGTASLVEGIVEQYANVSQADVESGNRRADYYKAISAINAQVAALTNQAQTVSTIEKLLPGISTQALSPTATTPAINAATSSVVSSQSGVPSMLLQSTPTVTPSNLIGTVEPSTDTTTTTATTFDPTPWIVGGVAAILAAALLL
jgi:hypothetical protein